MSKVKIEGNASGTGTLTISAPNTNTDRSLTLPDGAGEILTDATGLTSSSALNATNLTSGTIPDARFPSTLPAVDGSSLTGIDTSPPTTAGAVGTYAFLWHSTGSYAPSFGTTASGSSLYPSSVSTTNGLNSANTGYCCVGQTTPSQSGTWRCMGARSQTVYTYFVSLWIRIS